MPVEGRQIRDHNVVTGMRRLESHPTARQLPFRRRGVGGLDLHAEHARGRVGANADVDPAMRVQALLRLDPCVRRRLPALRRRQAPETVEQRAVAAKAVGQGIGQKLRVEGLDARRHRADGLENVHAGPSPRLQVKFATDRRCPTATTVAAGGGIIRVQHSASRVLEPRWQPPSIASRGATSRTHFRPGRGVAIQPTQGPERRERPTRAKTPPAPNARFAQLGRKPRPQASGPSARPCRDQRPAPRCTPPLQHRASR